jgi:hypothetical protein
MTATGFAEIATDSLDRLMEGRALKPATGAAQGDPAMAFSQAML